MSTQRRSKPLRPDLSPLTPADWFTAEPSTKQSTLTSGQKIASLHRLIEVERKRAARTINALTRYVELLEHVITSQREAWELLDKPLIPMQSKGKR
jgi:hypothetical protein